MYLYKVAATFKHVETNNWFHKPARGGGNPGILHKYRYLRPINIESK